MPENEKIELYEDQPIRTAWNEAEEEWYFSIVNATMHRKLLKTLDTIQNETLEIAPILFSARMEVELSFHGMK